LAFEIAASGKTSPELKRSYDERFAV